MEKSLSTFAAEMATSAMILGEYGSGPSPKAKLLFRHSDFEIPYLD